MPGGRDGACVRSRPLLGYLWFVMPSGAGTAPPGVSICLQAARRAGGWFVWWCWALRTRGRVSGDRIVCAGWLRARAPNGEQAIPLIPIPTLPGVGCTYRWFLCWIPVDRDSRARCLPVPSDDPRVGSSEDPLAVLAFHGSGCARSVPMAREDAPCSRMQSIR